MKIDGIRAQDIYQSYQKNMESAEAVKPEAPEKEAGKAGAGSGSSSSRDVIEISSQAASLKEAGALARKAMEENQGSRAARVEELKRLIDTGEYHVSSRDVARSLLKGALLDLKA